MSPSGRERVYESARQHHKSGRLDLLCKLSELKLHEHSWRRRLLVNQGAGGCLLVVSNPYDLLYSGQKQFLHSYLWGFRCNIGSPPWVQTNC